jgi:4-amino-4-deoxy-L-arabinose transferase-like glycosyltransferase
VTAVTAAIALALVAWQTRMTLVLWALDGALALILLLLATMAGMGLLALFRLRSLSNAWTWLLAAGLGTGLLAMLTLMCGVAGLVGESHRWVMPILLSVFSAFGAAWWLHGLRKRLPASDGPAESAGRVRWMFVAVAPFIALVLIVATIPPGILWQEEGYGYDVLEYHLQLPKEYYESGAIEYLPHNVYANFPSNMEMLYLAACLVTGDAVESWPVSKCLNALLAALFVAATWLTCREWSPQAGVTGGVLAAATGWVTYLSGIAYVENGMLLTGMLSCACVLRAARTAQTLRWCALAGVFVGFACGFKYPAVVLIALPVFVLLLIVVRVPLRRRMAAASLFALTALLAFSPWLIKNALMAGNPVFPLLGGVFTSYPAGWGAEQARHFAESHAPAPQEAVLSARIPALGRHVVFDPPQRFGAVLLVLAVAGMVRHRRRETCALVAMLLVQVVVWLFATHLYARFAVPLLVPLLVLAGQGVVDARGRLAAPLIALILAGAGVNLYYTGRLYAAHVYREGTRMHTEGGSVLFTDGGLLNAQHLATINQELPADANILLVGDAKAFYYLREVEYCVVFNRSRFVDAVERSATVEGILDWLRQQGITHVYVDWAEIERLRRSRYGFPNAITPSLFEQLEDAGLERLENYHIGDPARRPPYGTLFAIP